jgi:hypothetical protein
MWILSSSFRIRSSVIHRRNNNNNKKTTPSVLPTAYFALLDLLYNILYHVHQHWYQRLRTHRAVSSHRSPCGRRGGDVPLRPPPSLLLFFLLGGVGRAGGCERAIRSHRSGAGRYISWSRRRERRRFFFDVVVFGGTLPGRGRWHRRTVRHLGRGRRECAGCPSCYSSFDAGTSSHLFVVEYPLRGIERTSDVPDPPSFFSLSPARPPFEFYIPLPPRGTVISFFICHQSPPPPPASLVMRAAANKPNINIVAVNDPFIPVDYSESTMHACNIVERNPIDDPYATMIICISIRRICRTFAVNEVERERSIF